MRKFSIKKSLAVVKSLREGLINLYDNTARFHWTHSELLAYRAQHIHAGDYQRLPRWAQSELHGTEEILSLQLWKKVIFSYVVHGQRLTLDSAAYRAVKPQYVSEHCSESGAYVWRDAPAKLWTAPKGA